MVVNLKPCRLLRPSSGREHTVFIQPADEVIRMFIMDIASSRGHTLDTVELFYGSLWAFTITMDRMYVERGKGVNWFTPV